MPGQSLASQRIEFSVDPNGGTNFTRGDAVRVTAIRSKASWQAAALSDAGINLAQWDPTQGFPHNDSIVQKVYAFYQKMFDQKPSQLLWAGFAKMAGGAVYKGFQTIVQLRQTEEAWQQAQLNGKTSLEQVLIMQSDGYIGSVALRENYWSTEVGFLTMHKAIFEDLAWQHEAYVTQGIRALSLLQLAKPDDVPNDVLSAWQQIDSGDIASIVTGNDTLLHREQFDVLQPYYNELGPIRGILAGWNAKSFLISGQSFSDFEGLSANIADFDTRWDWITKQLLPNWNTLSDTVRRNMADATLGTYVH